MRLQSLNYSVIGAAALLLFSTSVVSAHVAVQPNTVGVASYQTFTIGVPSELNKTTTSVRLVIPKEVANVTPNVKPGWTIETKKTGEGEDTIVSEITWSGGSIPADQRDEFSFSAKTPAKPTTLQWKAYQTYNDGKVVSWDATPGTAEKEGVQGPYSATRVVDDLTPNVSLLSEIDPLIAPISLVVALAALYFSLRKD
jgi:uncharacterized protein YcnI